MPNDLAGRAEGALAFSEMDVQVLDARGQYVCSGRDCQPADFRVSMPPRFNVAEADFAELDSDAVVDVYLEFHVPEVLRAPVVEYRFDRVRALQEAAEMGLQFLEPMVEEYGVEIIQRRRLTPSAIVRGRVADILALAEAADLTDAALVPHHDVVSEYSGTEIRESVNGGDYHFGYNDGREGGRVGGRQRIAVIDSGFVCDTDGAGPALPHRSFLDNGWSTPPPSRVLRQRYCTSSSCSVNDVATCNNESHGTIVAWVAAGDLTDDQQPLVTFLSDQQELTGVAPESSLMLYRVAGTSGTTGANTVANAIEDAVINGADIINMSIAISSVSAGQQIPLAELCAQSYNPGGLGATLRAAVDAGAILFKSAGNDGTRSSCTLTFPAWRSEVITVGALDSPGGLAYGSTVLASYSSRGLMSLTRHGGGTSSWAPVSLVAPGSLERFPGLCGGTQFCTSSPGTPNVGTSWAAPAAAGALANMRDALRATVPTTVWGWTWMALVKLMGDGYVGLSNPAVEMDLGPSSLTGFGRVRAHHMDAFSVGSLGLLGWTHFTLSQGQTAYVEIGNAGPEPSAPHWIKTVLFAPDFDLADVPAFDARIEDTCPPGGGINVVETFNNTAIHKMAWLFPAQTSNRCLRMAVVGTSIPSGGIVVHVASYRYNNDSTLH